MWSNSFLKDERWEEIRDVMPVGVIRNWDQLSETTKRKSVERCAQQLLENKSVNSAKQDPIFEDIKTGKAFEPELGFNDIPRLMPKVYPFGEDLEYMDKTDPGLPGEIQLDVNGKLLTRYLRLTNFVKFLKDNYDHWLNTELIPLVNQTRIKIRGGVISFSNAVLMPPTIDTKRLYPAKARENGITYGLDLYANVYLEKVNPDGTLSKTILGDGSESRKKMGKIPLMLDSKRCYLHNLPPEELRRVGEDPSDPFGYFVVAGSDYVVLMQEKLRINRIFVTMSKKNNKDIFSEATITIEMPTNSVRVRLTIGKFKQILFNTRYQITDFDRNRSSKKEDEDEGEDDDDEASAVSKKYSIVVYNNQRQIGIEKLFYLLRVFENEDSGNAILDKETWAEDMTEQIVQFTKEKWKHKVRIATNILKFLYPIESEDVVISDVAKIKGGAEDGSKSSKRSVVKKMIMNELFPQVNRIQESSLSDNIKNLPNVFRLKSEMLAMMTCRLLETDMGLTPYDDRDSWTNKRLQDGSRAVGQLFRAVWNDMKKNIKKKFAKTKSIESIASINAAINKNKITDTFWNSFKNTNWGLPGNLKENMKQAFNKTSIVSMYSHMTRIDVKANRNDKQPSRRMVSGSQYGYVCPSESPEGGNCGLVKNLAITTQVTHDKLEHSVFQIIFDSPYFSFLFSPNYISPVLVNGKFIGWAQGKQLRDVLIRARRGTATIPIDTGIVLDTRNTLFVHTDTSRLVRPLLIVEPIETKDGKVQYEPAIITKGLMGASIKTLFDESVIEYVDCFEQESTDIYIAHTFEEVLHRDEVIENTIVQLNNVEDRIEYYNNQKKQSKNLKKIEKQLKEVQGEKEGLEDILFRLKKRKAFTHVELDPTSILGISANLIPYANHNQGPRNSYQSSMSKQALGIMRAHHMACFNGTHKVLAFPTRPIFEPQLNQILNLNAYPQGDMVWVAFSAETGFNQEDAFVFNRASIDAGKFRLFKYINHRITFKSDNWKVEKLMRPTNISDIQLRNTYKHIGNNGLPTIGAFINERQAIVGKVVMEGNKEIVNESLLMGFGEKGIVDRVVVTTNGGETIVSVRLRIMRFAIEGDKFAPRNAQKGTIGKILDPEDMPYTDRGIIPDILVNPHAMPSRMTHTYMMEILSGKAGAIVGERVNATTFREYDENKFKLILRDYGYNDSGYDIMYSGKTGQRIAVQIFQGPTYYQALKHHVMDKMQARREGAISSTTRQPVKGRSKGGGIRIGEMEQAAFGAHGVSAITEERLCGTSDCLKTVFCKCGQEAVGSLNSGYSCNLCGSNAEFGRVKTTYIMRLLTQFIGALGFRQGFNFDVADKGLKSIKDTYIPVKQESLSYDTDEIIQDDLDYEEREQEEMDTESFLEE